MRTRDVCALLQHRHDVRSNPCMHASVNELIDACMRACNYGCQVSAAYWLRDNKVMLLERTTGMVRFHEVDFATGEKKDLGAELCAPAHVV